MEASKVSRSKPTLRNSTYGVMWRGFDMPRQRNSIALFEMGSGKARRDEREAFTNVSWFRVAFNSCKIRRLQCIARRINHSEALRRSLEQRGGSDDTFCSTSGITENIIQFPGQLCRILAQVRQNLIQSARSLI